MITDEKLKEIAEALKDSLKGAAGGSSSENYYDDKTPPNFETTYEIARDKSHITFEVMLGPEFEPNPYAEAEKKNA